MSKGRMKQDFDAWIGAQHARLLEHSEPTAARVWKDFEWMAWAAWEAAMSESQEALASRLISNLALARGRPVEWHEAIEITATVTRMDDAEKERLLALGDD